MLGLVACSLSADGCVSKLIFSQTVLGLPSMPDSFDPDQARRLISRS